MPDSQIEQRYLTARYLCFQENVYFAYFARCQILFGFDLPILILICSGF